MPWLHMGWTLTPWLHMGLNPDSVAPHGAESCSRGCTWVGTLIPWLHMGLNSNPVAAHGDGVAGIVLLKNDYGGKGPLLPLDQTQVKKVSPTLWRAESAESLSEVSFASCLSHCLPFSIQEVLHFRNSCVHKTRDSFSAQGLLWRSGCLVPRGLGVFMHLNPLGFSAKWSKRSQCLGAAPACAPLCSVHKFCSCLLPLFRSCVITVGLAKALTNGLEASFSALGPLFQPFEKLWDGQQSFAQ
jgi:hypothetical protein